MPASTKNEAISDQVLVRQFEDASLPPERFGHEEHVRLAWLYVGAHTLSDALAAFTQGLKRYTETHGCPDKYHETITWAYLFLIHERVQRGRVEQTWQEFSRDNADLMRFKDGALADYYRPETLRSPLAKRAFLLPDRGITDR